MNIQDAIKSGKPFRRPCWTHGDYIRIYGDGKSYGKGELTFLTCGALTHIKYADDLLADDYELKQEPRKVTLYQYLYSDKKGNIVMSFEVSFPWEDFKVSEDWELLKTFTREIEY